MRPLTIFLLLVAVGAGLCAGLLHEPLAVLALRLLSCAAFVASVIAFALDLPRKPVKGEHASTSQPSQRDGASSLSARG